MAKPTPVEGLNRETPLGLGLKLLLFARLGDVMRHEADLLGEGSRGAPAPKTPNTPDAENDRVERVHDTRVAVRRMRAALSLCRFSPQGRRHEGQEILGRLGRALGAVRDLDLTLFWLDRMGRRADPEELLGIEGVRRRVAERHAGQLRHLDAAARDFFQDGREGEGGVNELLQLVGELRVKGGRLGGRRVRRRLLRRLRRTQAWLGPALSGRPDFVHELRIAAKKLRYHAELLVDVLPQAKDLAAALSSLQDGLGQVHDCDARLKWLQEQMGVAARDELPGVARLVREALMERERRFAEVEAELRRWHEEDRLGRFGHGL